MELTRKQVIDNLSYIADSMPDDVCAEWRDSLAYAISSLKTDEAYQIMYEGGEIFTKSDMVAMLTDIQLEIEKREQYYQDKFLESKNAMHDAAMGGQMFGCRECKEVIQQKIDALREVVEDGKRG